MPFHHWKSDNTLINFLSKLRQRSHKIFFHSLQKNIEEDNKSCKTDNHENFPLSGI